MVSAHANSGCKMEKQKYDAHKRKLYSQCGNISKYKVALFNSTHAIHTSSLDANTLLQILYVHCLEARLFAYVASLFQPVQRCALLGYSHFLFAFFNTMDFFLVYCGTVNFDFVRCENVVFIWEMLAWRWVIRCSSLSLRSIGNFISFTFHGFSLFWLQFLLPLAILPEESLLPCYVG